MALNHIAMKNEVIAAISNVTGNPVTALSQDVWEAVCQAIVAHIVSNAQVVVSSVSGVTTGAGVSGPGTGTIL